MSSGTTVYSVVTRSSALFEKANSFYISLGFILNAEWDAKTSAIQGGQSVHHSPDCERENTLILTGNGSDLNVVYLRLSPIGVAADVSLEQVNNYVENHKKVDWRGVATAAIFPVPKLPAYDGLKQCYPIFGDPLEMFVVDPIGNLLGFSSQRMVSTTVPRPKLVPHLKDSQIPEETRDIPGSGPKERVPPLKKIAVLTSGGDAPGMNAAVRAVVRNGIIRGCEMWAVYEGYEGLVEGDRLMKKVSWDDVRGFLSIGGTVIGTARCMAFKERSGRLQACHNMVKAGIDAIVVCGGDGSLTGADLFRSNWPSLIKELRDTGKITEEQYERHRHLYISGLVGSIDNDMAMTDHTIGASSSLDRICTCVNWIQATAESHSRAFVIEVMGRHCGWLALMAALATRADYVFIPEMPPQAGQWIDKMCKVVMRHRNKGGSRSTIVIVAEGAIDTDLNPIKSEQVKDALSEIGLDTRVTTFGHTQRGGTAVAFDRILATMQGAEAVDAILDSTPDTPSPMIGIRENKIIRTNLMEAVAETKKVAEAIARKDFDSARALRDSEFKEHLRNYLAISTSDRSDLKIPSNEPINVAIVAVGAPAGGVNAAVAAAASYCLARGHKPFTIANSWTGLSRHESISPISWHEINEIYARGGCEIGTNRQLPDCDYGMIAFYLTKYNIQGLIIIGGFEAYHSLQMLDAMRPTYPAFRIPMTCLPATVSNNVPGTETSLGTDTCLNALVDYCDIVKLSASSTRRRVFVVEVQGGESGYVAALCALVTGAYACYVPEEGISLTQMSADIKHLRECFKADNGRERAGRLVIRNECSAPGFTTENLTRIFETESHGHFDAREAIPGHLQQGGLPSPLDHVRATRLAIRCVQFIEDHQDVNYKDREASKGAAVVIGMVGSHVVFTPVQFLWENETEVHLRRSAKVHWLKSLELANLMTNRNVVVSGLLDADKNAKEVPD